MDIVIPYMRSGSGELEYAVKSCKNVKHDRIIIVGDKPNFEIEYIKPPIVRWSMLSPHHDVMNKILYACTGGISDDFVLTNDDIFILEPTDIPTAHRGTMEQHIAGRRANDSYTKTLKKTCDYLKSRGIEEPLSYELHIPIIYNRDKLLAMYDEVLPLVRNASVMLTRSLYGNLYNIGGEYMDDPKNPADYNSKTFLSTNDKTFQGEIGSYIKEAIG